MISRLRRSRRTIRTTDNPDRIPPAPLRITMFKVFLRVLAGTACGLGILSALPVSGERANAQAPPGQRFRPGGFNPPRQARPTPSLPPSFQPGYLGGGQAGSAPRGNWWRYRRRRRWHWGCRRWHWGRRWWHRRDWGRHRRDWGRHRWYWWRHRGNRGRHRWGIRRWSRRWDRGRDWRGRDRRDRRRDWWWRRWLRRRLRRRRPVPRVPTLPESTQRARY